MPAPRNRPKKSLGQNFLIDANTLSRIVEKLDLHPTDTIIEIGSGTGLLTERVQPLVQKMLAIEIDKMLAELLRQKFSSCSNLEILQADVLKTDLAGWCGERQVRVIGNIPYYITTPIIFHVLDHPGPIKDMSLLMQKEVGQRIVARPNSKEYGILAIFCQTYANVELLLTVPATVFRPKPKVDSSLVRWTFTRERSGAIKDDAQFRKLVRTAFNQRRKMLRATLRSYPLEKLVGWDLTRRPEDLTVTEWIKFANELM